MKAAVLYEPKTPLKLVELDLDEPGPGEALVKIMSSGVCHSDWHVIKGDWGNIPMPCVLGHEGAGIVEAVGQGVSTVKTGDHVILSWMASCGTCESCQSGYPNLCQRPPAAQAKVRLKGESEALYQMAGLGTFSAYTVVPEVAAVPIDKSIPFPQAALVGCGVTTGVGAAINTARVGAGSTVAVFGCGGVGLNCIQGAVIAGAVQIIAVDMLDNKLDLGREFGATDTVNASREDPVARIKELTGGQGVHYAFEAIGLVAEPFVQSVLCTRRRGVTVWVGHAPLDTPVTIDARALILEKTIIASMYGSARPHVDFPKILSLYKAGKLKLDELITRRFDLKDINVAFDLLARGEVARSVINFE
ncbi:MAG: Zn-dependent alcohol dehydrogenase [Chloroflexi bacterium]|nr:Zn-dependent alcohol dehydrogenase [Chloroflexota bacterium]